MTKRISEAVIKSMEARDTDISNDASILKIAEQVRSFKTRGVKNLSDFPPQWHQLRDGAIAISCGVILECYLNFYPSLRGAMETASKLLSLEEGRAVPIFIDEGRVINAFGLYWQFREMPEFLRDQIQDVLNSASPRRNIDLKKHGDRARPRSSGRPLASPVRNIVYARLLDGLRALGWAVVRNEATEPGFCAIDIVIEAQKRLGIPVLNYESLRKVWADYQRSLKKGEQYFGSTKKMRESAILGLITHA